VKTFIFYFFFFFSFIGCYYPEQKNEPIITIIEGKVYVVGNEPFTELAIQTKDGKVYTLRGNLVFDLRGLQGEWLKLKGKIIKDQHFLYSSEGLFVIEYKRTTLNGDTGEKKDN
jgi:hypothetical protein